MNNDWQEIGGGEVWNYRDLGRGAVLVGQLVSKETGVGDNNSNRYNLEKDNGEVVSVWGSTTLDTKFAQVKIGEMVRIEYMGMGKGKSGRSYHDFKVAKKPAPFKEVEPKITDEELDALLPNTI